MGVPLPARRPPNDLAEKYTSLLDIQYSETNARPKPNLSERLPKRGERWETER